MITVLLVAPAGAPAPAAPPSVEILRAETPEDAFETLSRNRRIDAVLFVDGGAVQATVELLAEERAVSWPPLFQAGAPAREGVTAVDPGSALADLVTHLEA